MDRNKAFEGHALKIVYGITMLALLLADGAGATTITVNASGGADYIWIQDAVNASNNGDTILVAAGTYNEIVVVNKSVSLIGAGADVTIVDASDPGNHVITITENRVNISGFTIKNLWTEQAPNLGYPYSGIYLAGVNYTNISNNKVSNNFYGITLFHYNKDHIPIGSNDNILINNTVTTNAHGIWIDSSYNNTLENNILYHNRYGNGIFMGSSSNNNITNNKATENTAGIYISYSNNNTLKNNTFASNQAGVYIRYSNGNILMNNNVNSNAGAYGITLRNSKANILTNNNILREEIGIKFEDSSENMIYNNILNNSNNVVGTFYNNTWNVTIQSNTNIVDGPFIGGNFWANPSGTGFSQTCTDANKNGICNDPYILDANNIDYLPLSMNFTLSYNLKGHVLNASSGIGISGAVVKLVDSPQYNATANSSGDYSMSVPSGTYNISASAAGYATNTTTVIVSANTMQDFALVPTAHAVGSDGVWVQVPNMTNSHVWGSGIITLDNGKVLVTVGANYPSSANIGTSSSELFDPLSRTWTTTGSVNQVRWLSGNAIVKMNDGKVMIAGNGGQGGLDLSSVELYDPSTGTWSYTGSLQKARRNPAVIKLQNGKVLITGGANGPPDGNRFLASTEIYDPATGQWSYSGNLNIARELGNHIILLNDGRVVIAGGEGPWWVQGDTAEIYDPNTGQWTLASPMLSGWGGTSMTVLNDGRVLVTGGIVPTQRAMLYNPGTNTMTETGSMNTARSWPQAVLLADGKVLVIGGGTISSEVYDPATGQWTTATETPRQAWHNGIAVLQNGDILAVGGDPEGLTAELFTESLSNSGKAFNISGYKINDTNGNGQLDAGEAGIPGWNITLKNATTGAIITSNLTDANGFYQFQNLANGTYNVSEEMKSGFTNVTPISIIVTINGADILNQNFTNVPVQVVMQTSITSPSQQTFAFGTSIDFTSEVAGGAPPYNYSWESSSNGIISTVQSFSISNLSIGTHAITLTVTDANGIKATDTKAITVTGVDLGIKSSDISFSNSWPMQNEEITINASITNGGSDSANNVSVQFYDGAILIGEALIPSISHQSSSMAEIRYAPNISGYRFIKVVVDEANNITEGAETNNIAIRPLSVGNGNFYGGIEISAFIDTPKYTGEYTRVYGSAVYNTTFGSGENVAGALVTITIDGKSYTTCTTSSGTFSTDIIAPYNSGQYPVVVRITDNTFVKEKSLILNVYPSPAQLPDLVITTGDITFPQTSYVVNESSTINATILNIGRADASEVTVNFYDDGNLFKTETISSIPNGGSVTTSGIFTPSHSGTHTITVKVDANNTIPETNENNNQAFRSLYVYPDLPDFTPSYIYYSDSTPYDGQQVTVYAYIVNIGVNDSATNVSFYLDNNFINTVPISVPGRNGYATASLPITFVNPGTHQIKVITDETGNVREADEGNNQTTSSIYVHTPQPDLRADDIFLNITDPVLGDSVLVTGVFRNDGETSANNVIANLYIGGTLVNSIPITNLAAGSAETIISSWTPITNGYFDIQLSIDPQNTIVESNEDNNVRTETYYIYPDLPDPYPISLVSTPIMADIGQPVNIEAIIKNKGGTSTGMMNVSFYDDDLEISSSRVEVPGKGGTVPVSKVYSFATNGTHTIKVKADPDNALLEFDDSNNELTSTIYILSPLPDIQILSEDIYYSNNNPMIDEIVVIYANVSNIGTYQAENIDVKFYIDDILINTTMISSISSKSSIIVTSDWIAEGNGSHVVRIETVFSGLELSKTNNVATRGLVVGQDAVPPSSVTNLHNITYASTHINWTWTDPIDPDFDKVMIYLNGTFQRNATNGTQYYNATGLTPNTSYEISTRTVDLAGNINSAWENQSAMTAPAVNENTPPGNSVQVSPAPNVTVNFSNVTASGNTTVNVTTTNPRSDKTGFKFQKTYYDFITDAVYTGPITICLNYDDSGLSTGRERNLKIFHWNDSIGWEDVTTSLDTDNNVVCGTVSSFSWFGIAELLPTERFINGTVKDNSTGNGLAGVTVSANSTLSKTTNASGFYSFAVNEGTYELTATFDITYYTNTTTVSTIGEAVVIQDIELIKKPTGNITGSVSAK